ncbi:hypothetical protein H4582DRAFT_2051759 [Lactarius indigo]|nr:hypothetical protein H4582DRAFT_2051759 [Lactarius indigo]
MAYSSANKGVCIAFLGPACTSGSQRRTTWMPGLDAASTAVRDPRGFYLLSRTVLNDVHRKQLFGGTQKSHADQDNSKPYAVYPQHWCSIPGVTTWQSLIATEGNAKRSGGNLLYMVAIQRDNACEVSAGVTGSDVLPASRSVAPPVKSEADASETVAQMKGHS